jgi:hypothetical protein
MEAVTEASVAKVASRDALNCSRLLILPAADPEKALNDDVATKEPEFKFPNNPAFSAYEDVATEPLMVAPLIEPETVKLPVICTSPI